MLSLWQTHILQLLFVLLGPHALYLRDLDFLVPLLRDTELTYHTQARQRRFLRLILVKTT